MLLAPGQAALGLDFELAIRAWLHGYAVGSVGTSPRRRPASFVIAQPARVRNKALAVWNGRPARPTSEVNGEVLDEIGKPIGSPTSPTTRFRAWNFIVRPRATQHQARVWEAYTPFYDEISRKVHEKNDAMRKKTAVSRDRNRGDATISRPTPPGQQHSTLEATVV